MDLAPFAQSIGFKSLKTEAEGGTDQALLLACVFVVLDTH